VHQYARDYHEKMMTEHNEPICCEQHAVEFNAMKRILTTLKEAAQKRAAGDFDKKRESMPERRDPSSPDFRKGLPERRGAGQAGCAMLPDDSFNYGWNPPKREAPKAVWEAPSSAGVISEMKSIEKPRILVSTSNHHVYLVDPSTGRGELIGDYSYLQDALDEACERERIMREALRGLKNTVESGIVGKPLYDSLHYAHYLLNETPT
jgi:hypothetical protein